MNLDGEDVDYYKLLEVPRTASDEEIKQGYRKQARRWHPDKNPDNKAEAEAKFKLIAEAYQILSDPSKRETYNMYGRNVALGRSGGSDLAGAAADFSKFKFRTAAELFKEFFPDDTYLIGLLEGLDSQSYMRAQQGQSSVDSPFQYGRAGEPINMDSYVNQSADDLFRAQFGDSPLYKQFYGDTTPASGTATRAGESEATKTHAKQQKGKPGKALNPDASGKSEGVLAKIKDGFQSFFSGGKAAGAMGSQNSAGAGQAETNHGRNHNISGSSPLHPAQGAKSQASFCDWCQEENKSTPVEYFCINCKKLMCQLCEKHHRRQNKQHDIRSL